MLQKLIIGMLAITVIGALGVGIYDAAQPPTEAEASTIAISAADNSTTVDASDTVNTAASVPANTNLDQGQPQNNQAEVQADVTAGEPIQQQQSTDMVGEAWQAIGIIVQLDDVGFDLQLADGTVVYVELGQPTYWQAQGVALTAGDLITIDGFNNGENIHAGTVTTTIGEVLIVRTADGQPMWSGGVQNGNQGSDHSSEGQEQVEARVAPEDWLTLSGTIVSFDGSMITLNTVEGETMTFQLGQPRFWQDQGVTLSAGDEVTVLGFWEGSQFQAGEVTRTATGERIMLRDPNGRPLWGGPGRNGNGGNGNGNGGNQSE